MVGTELERQLGQNFLYKPTEGQRDVFRLFAGFLLSADPHAIFLLKGYAGTGKTSVVGTLVKTLGRLKRKCVLLAPTGRAAKVFSRYSGHPAYTVHRMIYRQASFSNEMDNFMLNTNLHRHTLFIVDEASMIANEGLSGSLSGSGRLLDDLITYVYGSEGCRLILVGDTAQLPPVGEEGSPALSVDNLRGYGLSVMEKELTEVVRQGQDSGVLYNATRLRLRMMEGACDILPRIRMDGFPDVRVVSGAELPEAISTCYDRDGVESTIVICRSNKRANLYNKGIRNTILWREDELVPGDILMVAKNNYFWGNNCEGLDFIANGDLSVVRRVRHVQEMYGFRFADVLLSFPDYQDVEIEAKVLLDTLHSDSPSLTKDQSDRLFHAVWEDYQDVTVKRERMKKIKSDPWYNALQVKYAYAVTCHKAQGGQWNHVFVDQGYLSEDMLSLDYYRWLYTAFTRAIGTLYLVNWPERQTEQVRICK